MYSTDWSLSEADPELNFDLDSNFNQTSTGDLQSYPQLAFNDHQSRYLPKGFFSSVSFDRYLARLSFVEFISQYISRRAQCDATYTHCVEESKYVARFNPCTVCIDKLFSALLFMYYSLQNSKWTGVASPLDAPSPAFTVHTSLYPYTTQVCVQSETLKDLISEEFHWAKPQQRCGRSDVYGIHASPLQSSR